MIQEEPTQQRLPRAHVRRSSRRDPRAAGRWAIVVGGAIVAGLIAGAGYGPLIMVAVFLVVVVALGVASWRRSMEWAMYYLPFSGLLPLALYPSQGPATLFKDAAFVIPAYIGALFVLVKRRERLTVPRAPVVLLAALTILVFVEALNPRLLRPLVGLIGIREWLFYIPLLALGYHMYSDKASLQRLLKWMTILSLIPCGLGVIEAALVYGGHSGLVYRLYGAAAAATTQDFSTLTFGGSTLTRISSIFTFVAQYWFFSTAAIAVAWAAWRGNREDRTMRWLGPTAITIATLASMTSGLRAAFIFAPLLLVMMAALEGFDMRRIILGAVGSVLAVVVVLYSLGIPFGPLASLTSGHTSFILGFDQQGMSFGFHHALLGLGTGADTNQARYAFNTNAYGTVYATLGGTWYESTYLQAFLELGLAGLLVFLALCGALVRRSLQAHRAITDPESRAISAAFVGLVLWTLIFSVKTTVIDDDPLDVYFWLFIGIQWRLGDAALAMRQAKNVVSSGVQCAPG